MFSSMHYRTLVMTKSEIESRKKNNSFLALPPSSEMKPKKLKIFFKCDNLFRTFIMILACI